MNHQLATPKSDSERREERRGLQQLHPGNRFRLMFGQSLLPQDTPLPKLPTRNRVVEAREPLHEAMVAAGLIKSRHD